MKKSLLISLIFSVLAFFVISPIHSHADTDEHNHDHELHQSEESISEGDVGLMYVPCPGGGKHYMQGAGSGWVYINGDLVIDRGQASQCSKCYLVLVSYYNPFNPGINKLGNYAVASASEPVGPVGVSINATTLYYNSNIADMESYTWAGR